MASFASMNNVKPLDHDSARSGVLAAVDVMVALPDASADEIVRQLRLRGYPEVAAEKLNVFVPSALSWILLKRMGIMSFPSHYIALSSDGKGVELPLAEEHYFTAALHLAYVTLENGWSEALPRTVFDAVIRRSAELGAANQALAEQASIAGGSLGPMRVFQFSAETARGSAF